MSYKYFEAKHVWITGASSGIGAGLAKALTKAGAIVSLSARREADILELIKELEKTGGKAYCFPLDVTDSKAIVETHKKIIAQVGPVDIVIANAGVGQSGVKAVDLTIEKVEKMVDTNLTGAIMTIVACLPDMIARRSGHVVGISSLASYRGMPGSSVYSAVKAGLNIFLESVRVENIKNGISVTEICPGFVDTPILNGTTQPTPGKIPLSQAVTEIMNAMVAKKRHHGFPWVMEHILMNITVWMPAWIYEKAVWLFRK